MNDYTSGSSESDDGEESDDKEVKYAAAEKLDLMSDKDSENSDHNPEKTC